MKSVVRKDAPKEGKPSGKTYRLDGDVLDRDSWVHLEDAYGGRRACHHDGIILTDANDNLTSRHINRQIGVNQAHLRATAAEAEEEEPEAMV